MGELRLIIRRPEALHRTRKPLLPDRDTLNFRSWPEADMACPPSDVGSSGQSGHHSRPRRSPEMTLCGHIEFKTDRKGRDEKHCGSTTEVLLSP